MEKLRELNLPFNCVRDLKAIRNLKLESLKMRCNQSVKNAEYISNMTTLKELDLYGCGIDDLGFISTLYNLEILNLKCNPIREIGPLKRLHNLKMLYVNSELITEPDFQELENIYPFINSGSTRSMEEIYERWP